MSQGIQYIHDIFISYAHDDNYGIGDNPGWVDTFEEALTNWLKRRRGFKSLCIWRDTGRMRGNTLFDDAIRKAVESSAIFFALISPNYLQSEYCLQELEWFHQFHGRHPGGLRIGNDSRIFTLLLRNIHHDQWPQQLPRAKGFLLHDAPSDDALGDFTSPHAPEFEKQLRPIVDAAEPILYNIVPPADASQPQQTEENQVTLYVADVADSLQDFKERLITEVRSPTITILTDIPPPMDMESHHDRVKHSLEKAHFSIHLLDASPGRQITDQRDATYCQAQLQLARDHDAAKLVWVPPELDIATNSDEVHHRFLEGCEGGLETAGRYEFIRSMPTEFIDLVLARIDQFQESDSTPFTPLSYLIDTHQKDQRYAFKLADMLAGSGAQVDFNHESVDPLKSLDIFQSSIKKVKHLILIYGKVGTNWLVGRIKNAFKTISEQFYAEETATLEHIWVFLAPTSGDQPHIPPLPPLIHVDILDNSQSEAIDPEISARLLSPGARS